MEQIKIETLAYFIHILISRLVKSNGSSGVLFRLLSSEFIYRFKGLLTIF